MHKFIHTFAKYNLQVPNTNAVAVPIANANAIADLNAQIHSYFAKYVQPTNAW